MMLFTRQVFASAVAVLACVPTIQSSPQIERRDGRTLLGFRAVSEEQAQRYMQHNTVTPDPNIEDAGMQIGRGVYTTLVLGDYHNSWYCALFADKSKLVNEVDKIYIPRRFHQGDTDVDVTREIHAYIKKQIPGADPKKTLLISYLNEGPKLQMLIPFGLLNAKGGGLDITVECAPSERELEKKIQNVVRYPRAGVSISRWNRLSGELSPPASESESEPEDNNEGQQVYSPPSTSPKPSTSQTGGLQAGADACLREQYGGDAKRAFLDLYTLLEREGIQDRICPTPAQGADAAACARDRYQGDESTAFFEAYRLLKEQGFLDLICGEVANAGAEPMETEETLRAFDWSSIELPEDLRGAVAAGQPTQEQCAVAFAALLAAWGSRPQHKRSLLGIRPSSRVKRQAKENSCVKLATKIRTRVPGGKAASTRAGPAKFVFYGDYLWPEEAKRQGGFLPEKLMTPSGGELSVDSADGTASQEVEIGWPSYFLPISQFFGTAAKQAAESASKATKGFAGVVYLVHATPNMATLGKNHMAAVGGIRWEQVLAWAQVPIDYTFPNITVKKHEMQQHFEKAFQHKIDIFHPNPDYNHSFDNYTAQGNASQLEQGSKESFTAFMERNGKAVGWKGAFPLFTPPEVITREVSRAAKVNNAVAAPHTSGLESIWGFFKKHVVAIVALPAVLALNLVPGLGEVADAAEFAALGAGFTEGIELTEMGADGAFELSPLLEGAVKFKVE